MGHDKLRDPRALGSTEARFRLGEVAKTTRRECKFEGTVGQRAATQTLRLATTKPEDCGSTPKGEGEDAVTRSAEDSSEGEDAVTRSADPQRGRLLGRRHDRAGAGALRVKVVASCRQCDQDLTKELQLQLEAPRPLTG